MNGHDDQMSRGKSRRWRGWLLLAIVLVVIAVLIGYGKPPGKPWMPVPTAYSAGAGEPHYCISLAAGAQGLSYKQLIIGWLLISLGALAGLAGGVLGSPGQGDKPLSVKVFLRAYRGVLLLGVASISTAGGWHFLDRSKAATEAAMAATEAVALLGTTTKDGRDGNRVAYENCVKAKSEWLVGRTDYSRLSQMVAEVQEAKVKDAPPAAPNDKPPQ